MMRSNTIFLFFALTGATCFAQTALVWSEDYTADCLYNFTDEPAVHLDEDTIVVTGIRKTVAGERLQIVRYDVNGDILSEMLYGDDAVSNSEVIDYKVVDSSI